MMRPLRIHQAAILILIAALVFFIIGVQPESHDGAYSPSGIELIIVAVVFFLVHLILLKKGNYHGQ